MSMKVCERFGCEDDAVLLFASPGQSYGRGGCSRPPGDHSQHTRLCGLAVWQSIGATASHGVCRDGRYYTGVHITFDRYSIT